MEVPKATSRLSDLLEDSEAVILVMGYYSERTEIKVSRGEGLTGPRRGTAGTGFQVLLSVEVRKDALDDV